MQQVYTDCRFCFVKVPGFRPYILEPQESGHDQSDEPCKHPSAMCRQVLGQLQPAQMHTEQQRFKVLCCFEWDAYQILTHKQVARHWPILHAQEESAAQVSFEKMTVFLSIFQPGYP